MKSSVPARHIFLVGVKGVGKSVSGRELARQLGRVFTDLDDTIERLFAADSGHRLMIREIYRLDGGATFRRLEAAAAAEVAISASPAVIATGGGICDNPEASGALRQGVVVHLNAAPEVLFRRIMRRGIPAYFSATTREDAWVEFVDLHRRRSTRYADMADTTVTVDEKGPREIVDTIVEHIEEIEHGGK